MREITFRAWDTEKKEFWYVHFQGRTIIFPHPSFTGERRDNLFPAGKVFDNVDCFQQFTGLKDKNSKNIYEGDIVQRSFGRKHDVVWHEWTASFRIGRYAITEINGGEDLEVIGNIYETPELLK